MRAAASPTSRSSTRATSRPSSARPSATACSAATTASPCARGTSSPEAARETKLQALASTDSPPLAELLALDDAAFRKRFAGTPVKRTGRDRVVRNALIAAGNSGDADLIPAVERLLDDASPLVRAMAVWALQQLAEPARWAAAKGRRLTREADADVRAEWGGAAL